MVKSEQLTFETDFRYAPDYIERITTSPQLITYFYGPVEIYNGGEIRKNFAGSYDAFVGGKCIRQTVGKRGAYCAIDQRNGKDLFSC